MNVSAQQTDRGVSVAQVMASRLPLTGHAFAVKADVDANRRSRGRTISEISEAVEIPHEILIGRVAEARDKAAFAQLFGHFAPRVKSYLIKLGLNGEAAEDLAQDALVAVWSKAHQYNAEKAKLSTWIFRIARNKFIDQTRRQKYPEVNADDHMAQMVAPEVTDEPVIADQTSKRVMAALVKLKPDQRTVIELSFFQELSHSQMARELDLPLGTVKSRIRLAFKALRNELGEME